MKALIDRFLQLHPEVGTLETLDKASFGGYKFSTSSGRKFNISETTLLEFEKSGLSDEDISIQILELTKNRGKAAKKAE